MTDIDAKAREIAEKHGLVCLVGPGVTSHEYTLCDCKVIELLSAALLAVRYETLEEAAKAAENVFDNDLSVYPEGPSKDDVATAIRRMKDTAR